MARLALLIPLLVSGCASSGSSSPSSNVSAAAPAESPDAGTGSNAADRRRPGRRRARRPPLPPASTARYAVRTAEVGFTAPDGLRLVGTLHAPRLARPHGAVLLIHGSGPQSRRGTVNGQLGMAFGFEIAVLEGVARGLAERGWSCLVYDKRSCGPFNGCADNSYPEPGEDLTLKTFLLDAIAAVDFLGAQSEIGSPERVVVAGHSQGATLVPHVLQARTGVAGGLLLAAPHSSIDDLFDVQAAQIEEILKAQGAPLTAAQPIRDIGQQLRALRAQQTEGRVAGAPAVFWRSWLTFSDSAPSMAKSSSRPLLVLQGGMDWNVPKAERRAWADTLLESPRARVMTVPKVTHALNRVRQSDITKIRAADIGRGVDPTLLDVMIRFLQFAVPEEEEEPGPT